MDTQTMTSLTQKEALELFIYDPELGSLIWKKSGKFAGYISKTDGYITVMCKKKNYKAHRIAWLMTYGEWPDSTDHIDHNRVNNKINNLRSVSHVENSKNMGLRGTNKSGHVGVCWHTKGNKWMAYIHINYKMKNLGLFSDISDAIVARQKASENCGFHKNHGK